MRALERRNDPFRARKGSKCFQRLRVGNRYVGGPAGLLQMRMLGTNARVIKPSANRVRLHDLPKRGLQKIRTRSVQHSYAPGADRGGRTPAVDALSRGFDAPQPHVFVVQKRREDSHGIASAADARDHIARQAPEALQALRARLYADDLLKFAYHIW